MVTMDHATATLTGAAERYVLREMSEQERETYEEHFFSCPHCADEVSAASRFVENATPLLRTEPRLRRQLQAQAAAPAPPPQPLRQQFHALCRSNLLPL